MLRAARSLFSLSPPSLLPRYKKVGEGKKKTTTKPNQKEMDWRLKGHAHCAGLVAENEQGMGLVGEKEQGRGPLDEITKEHVQVT